MDHNDEDDNDTDLILDSDYYHNVNAEEVNECPVDIKQLKNDVEQLELKLLDAKAQQKQSRNGLERLQDELKASEQEKRALKAKLRRADKTIQTQAAQLEQHLRSDVRDEAAIGDGDETGIQELKAKLDEADTRIRELQTEVVNLLEEKERLRSEVKTLKDQVTKHEQELDEVEHDESDFKSLRRKIRKLEKELEDKVLAQKLELEKVQEELVLHRQGIHVVAFKRVLEHIDSFVIYAKDSYVQAVEPTWELASIEVTFWYGRMNELGAPIIAQIQEVMYPLLEPIEKPYRDNVVPVLEDMNQELARHRVSQRFQELKSVAKDQFRAFRDRGIRTLKKKPLVAPHARSIFDGCLGLVVLLSTLLTSGPIVRFLLRVSYGILYYSLCCCCFTCCRGSRRARVKMPPVARDVPGSSLEPPPSPPRPPIASRPLAQSPLESTLKQRRVHSKQTGSI